jgi:aryl-alcohol dehydrogenase-like predicted oxidoreductase
MTVPSPAIPAVTIGPRQKPVLPLGFGGSWFVPYREPGAADADYLAAMEACYDAGIRHFDTGATYGAGHSEELYGRFIKARRDDIFLASKVDPADGSANGMVKEIEASLRRLGTDFIDLYYIHWPARGGRDMRPTMEGLERARAHGKIGAVGVSNFSVADMRQVGEAGTIDAHQLGYNLLWRFAEADVIPYCRAHGIAVVCYSALAHGILSGKFPRTLDFPPEDQRNTVLPFRPDIWPHVHAGVERLKAIAATQDRPLMHLALRWILRQPGITAVIFGGRNAGQAAANAGALQGGIADEVFTRMTAISDDIVRHMPHENNLFGRKP